MGSYLSLSFDDGRLDSFENGYLILKKYGIPATFNITTGYVLGNRMEDIGTKEPPMTVEMVRELYRDPSIEIAGHGDRHANTLEDLVHGLERLRELLRVEALYDGPDGLASPGSELESLALRSVLKALPAYGVGYVRVSARYRSCAPIKILMRKVSRVIPVPFLYAAAYGDTLMYRMGEDRLLYSIPVLGMISVAELDAILKRAMREGKSCILMFHSIVPAGARLRDNWDFPADKFEALCAKIASYASKGRLVPVRTRDLFLNL